MKKIILTLPLLLVTGCEYTQPAAKVEYRLEDYYGYGDVQGPPTEGSKEAVSMQNKGVPVVIEDVSKDGQVNPVGDEIQQQNIEPLQTATQVYTVSDNVGPAIPKGVKIVREKNISIEQEVGISNAVHTVAKGETLFSISRKYDVPILPIIVANSLEPPYSLKAGQQIKIPEGKFHSVQEGETLYSISRLYGVDMSGIVKLNNMSQPYNVVKGQRLQIPFPSDLPTEESYSENQVLAESEVQSAEVIKPNQIGNQADDDSLFKPASLSRNSGGVLGSYSNINKPEKAIDTEIENDKLASKVRTALSEQSSVVQDGNFMWPVQGKVIKKFGQQGGGYNDGINIAASSGVSVKASNSGRVVYTGNSLKSYGNMVIIKHDNGLLSAYAHMNNINVKKDQKISKGQTIGTIGATGKVTSPQLYFAIRKGKDAKNPMNYLR